MIKQNVFGTTVIKIPCENPKLWQGEQILNTVQTLIQQPDFDGVVPEQQGQARSTVMNLRVGQIAHLEELQPLMQWIRDQVWQLRADFNRADSTNIILGRNWANEMYRGCRGTVHQHYTHVAVFYLRVPDGGADMQFEQNGEIILAGANEGDLLIHEPLVWHSVSEHQSDTSRICLVIEFEYV